MDTETIEGLLPTTLIALLLSGCSPPAASDTPSGPWHRVDVDRFVASGDEFSASAGRESIIVDVRRGHSDPGALIQVATREIAHGDQFIWQRTATHVEMRRSGASVSWMRGGVTEEAVHRSHGVEQRWRFDRALPGDGDLVVVVDVSGTSYQREGSGGLVFANMGSTGLIQYGHGVWVDAEGDRTEVPAVWTGDAIELRVPEATVVESAFPAVLDPLIGPAHQLTVPELTPHAHSRSRFVSATNGTEHLVLFTEGSRTVVGTRLRNDGTIVDRIPELIVGATCIHPRLFWEGSQYRLFCLGTHSYTISSDLSTVGPLTYHTPIGSHVANDVAFDGASEYLITWATGGDESDILGLRIDTDGSALDMDPFVIADGPRIQTEPAATWLGSSYYVAYVDDRYTSLRSHDIRGTVVSRSGVAASTDGAVIADDATAYETSPFLIGNGAGALLSWRGTNPSGTTNRVESVALDSAGAVTSPSILSFSIGPPGGEWTGAWTGVEWLLALRSNASNAAWTFDAAATGSRPYPLLPDPMGSDLPTISWGAGEPSGVIAWARRETSTESVAVAAGLTTGGAIAPESVLTVNAPVQRTVVTAAHDTGYVAAFSELDASGNWRLYSVPLAPDGRPLTEPTYLMRFGRFYPNTNAVRLTRGSSSFLLVVLDFDERERRLFELDDMGVPIEPAIPSAPLDATRVDVAFGGSSYLMAFRTMSNRVMGRIVDNRGTPLGADFEVSSSSGHQWPAVGASSGRYLLTWVEDDGTGDFDLHGTRIELDGTVVDRSAIVISDGPERAWETSVAPLPTGWLVGWTESTPGGGAGDTFIRHTRVASTGAVDPIQTVTTSEPQANVRVDVAGGLDRGVVAWAIDEGPSVPVALVGSIVDASGAVVSARSVLVPELIPPSYSSVARGSVGDVGALTDIASGTANTFLFGYHAFDPVAREFRAQARVIAFDTEVGAPCTTPTECPTGHCVDGVCCLSTCAGGASDCQACSLAAGGTRDGICSVATPGVECRSSAHGCDPAESCDGVSTTCPPDIVDSPPELCAVDAGSPVDEDAGVHRADGGTTATDGGPDAGAGGATDGGADAESPSSEGCACRAGKRGPPAAPYVAFALIGLVARRRGSRKSA